MFGEVWSQRLPTGALRPPVAIGALDAQDDFTNGHVASTNSPSNKSFRSNGGWSFPALQSNGGGGGWSFPAAQSHETTWEGQPVFAEPISGGGGGGVGGGGGWGGLAVEADYDSPAKPEPVPVYRAASGDDRSTVVGGSPARYGYQADYARPYDYAVADAYDDMPQASGWGSMEPYLEAEPVPFVHEVSPHPSSPSRPARGARHLGGFASASFGTSAASPASPLRQVSAQPSPADLRRSVVDRVVEARPAQLARARVPSHQQDWAPQRASFSPSAAPPTMAVLPQQVIHASPVVTAPVAMTPAPPPVTRVAVAGPPVLMGQLAAAGPPLMMGQPGLVPTSAMLVPPPTGPAPWPAPPISGVVPARVLGSAPVHPDRYQLMPHAQASFHQLGNEDRHPLMAPLQSAVTHIIDEPVQRYGPEAMPFGGYGVPATQGMPPPSYQAPLSAYRPPTTSVLMPQAPPPEAVPMGPPPPPPPKPPAWTQRERRLHLLEVELEDVRVHPDSQHPEPAWYESVRYFVSFHPHSEEPDDIQLPEDAPNSTVPGRWLVSQQQPPQSSKGSRFTLAKRAGGGDGSPGAGTEAGISVTFKEPLAMKTDHFDTFLVAYLWARKSSIVGGEQITLVGRALAPLQEFRLQRRATTWRLFDVLNGHVVADMRLKYSVATTPAAVLKPGVRDVKQNEVTVRWEPPETDHGSPLIGYKVSILLDAKQTGEPQWYTLCDCTKSLNPIYVVANLTGNTAYMVDVRAVNKVGAGDPCEFQITTAPIEPDPPPKPWIEEARDGCVNVAWYPSSNDGGQQITSYKVKMRKIVGATKWNPFGPGESKAAWVDMGSVMAAVDEQEQPSMYNAWIGPLETLSCEYRFQVVAVSRAGESRGSELSDGHYT